MFGGGLRPCELNPINRGCVNTIVFLAVERGEDNCEEKQINKTNKKLYLTAKTQPWDDVANDSDAVFKIVGTIPEPVKEPGRVVFTLSEHDSYLDPTVPYYYDIVETDLDGASNANRLCIGSFNVTPGPNNAQAGGDTE